MRSMVVIGLAGGTCSGKSTLANALCRHLGSENCIVLSMDNFYKQQSQEALLSGTANFERPDAIDLERFVSVVESMCSGREVSVPDYDRKTSCIIGTRILKPRRTLIVEGLFVLFDKRLRQYLDVAIFLEVDPVACLSRRLQRDVVEYGLSSNRVRQWHERYTVPAYAEFVAPTSASAELVLSGTARIEYLLAQVLTQLQRTEAVRLEAREDSNSE